MAGDIKYRVVVDGLQDAATNAQKLDAALQGVKKSMQGLSGGKAQYGLATPITGFGSTGGSPLMMWPEGELRKRTQSMMRELGRSGLLAQQASTTANPLLGSFLNQGLGIGAGQMRYTGAARAGYQNFWQSAVPPMIPPAAKINWTQAAIGLGVSPFSPWLGARNLSSAFGGVLGGSKAGGVGSAIFGASGPAGMAVWFAAIRAMGLAMSGVAHAFRELHSAIKEGARLYQDSARTGIATGKTFHLQSIGRAIGLTPEQIETLLVRGEHPLKGGGATMSQRDVGAVFGAGRGTQQIALLQQMTNMSDYIARAWKDTAAASLEMSVTAKPLQEMMYQLSILSIEWKTAWAELATAISPALKVIIQGLIFVLNDFNMKLFAIIKAMQALGMLKVGEPGNNVISAGRSSPSFRSSFERMGFSFGAGGTGGDYARRTAIGIERLVGLATGRVQSGYYETMAISAVNLP